MNIEQARREMDADRFEDFLSFQEARRELMGDSYE
jgi:hypothetical protein